MASVVCSRRDSPLRKEWLINAVSVGRGGTGVHGDVQELGHDGGRRNLDEDDVVEADAVEGVKQREDALDLIRFDHALEDVFDRDVLALAC
jgi:hypothetical protein